MDLESKNARFGFLEYPLMSLLMLQLVPVMICNLTGKKIFISIRFNLVPTDRGSMQKWLCHGFRCTDLDSCFYSGQQPNAPGENPPGQRPGGGVRKRLHRHQRQLQPLWQIPRNEVHPRRNGGRSPDIWVSAGEIQSHPPGDVNVTLFCLSPL